MVPNPDAESKADSAPSDAAQRWRLTEDLFHRAMECAPQDRARKIAEWTGSDTAMHAALLELLAADICIEKLISSAPVAESGSFLERGNTGSGSGDPAESSPQDSWLGRVLGPFRLERLLGRGGMGVVYLGRRISGGFSQTVAIKLVGWHLQASPAVAQFLLERETLARLEHPNIARLIDGGVTEEGFPYVVMEYVEGQRLDTACDDPTTSIDQILRWMLQLCNAVTYVHRNLILHRDLKPGNVMVTDSDGGAMSQSLRDIKLLDFGTLKRIGPGAEADSAMTQAGMRPVTIRYASPEHIQGGRASTSSDVFSLGMILYRLIAGRLPEELDELPLGHYLERLKEGGFKPPSDVAATSSSSRPIESQVARDLNAIVAKALRTEPEARYPTASALAEDLASVLAHRPVAARTGSLNYLAAKFYRRNRWAVRAVAAVLLVLIIGLSAMAWQSHLARIEQLRAERGVEDERQLAHMLLFDYFEQLAVIPGSIEAQRKAVSQALSYLDSLALIAPGSNLEIDTIRGYTDMGNLLGNPYLQNLGNVPAALQTLNKGRALAQLHAKAEPENLDALNALNESDLALGGLYLGNGDALHAEEVLLEGKVISDKIAKNAQVKGKFLELAATVLENLGDVYDPGRGFATADMNKAMESYLLSDHYDELCQKIEPANRLCRFGLPVGQYKFGMLVEDTDPALAATHYQQGMASAGQFPADEQSTTRVIRLHNYLGSRFSLMQIKTGHMAEGLVRARQMQEAFRGIIAKDDLNNRARFDLVAFDTDLAVTLDQYGREREAEDASREDQQLLTTLLSRSPNNLRWQMIQAQDLMTYGRIETRLGHKQAAAEAQRKGLDEAVRLAQSPDASPEVLGDAADDLLELHLHPADVALALSFAQRSVNAYAKPQPSQLITLARAQKAAGKSIESNRTAQLALAALNGPIKSRIVQEEISEAQKLSIR